MLINEEENQYINKTTREMKLNSYHISFHHKKKILTIIACHTNNLLKYNTIMNNIKYFCFINNDIIIINSLGENYSNQLKETLKNHIKSYYEIPNNIHLDIGKWIHVLKNVDYTSYDHIVFTNDSFLINSSIAHFFNKMIKTNVELYGYNDSTELKYHYQSYLFGIQIAAIDKLIKLYLTKKHLLVHYDAVVKNIELNLVNTFKTCDCFLKIGNLYNQGRNIFFKNDKLYKKLYSTKLLPFVKLKTLSF